MKTPRVLAIVGSVAAVAAWAAFRPKFLFLDREVNEPLPAALLSSR